nr:immunoglobulin heavy chain junction region [Macaca mulatta]
CVNILPGTTTLGVW